MQPAGKAVVSSVDMCWAFTLLRIHSISYEAILAAVAGGSRYVLECGLRHRIRRRSNQLLEKQIGERKQNADYWTTRVKLSFGLGWAAIALQILIESVTAGEVCSGYEPAVTA